MEAFNFTAANEDCNLYTYDMRKLDVATCVHKVGGGGRGWRRQLVDKLPPSLSRQSPGMRACC